MKTTHPYNEYVTEATTPGIAQRIVDICNRHRAAFPPAYEVGTFYVDASEFATGKTIYATTRTQSGMSEEAMMFWDTFIEGVIAGMNEIIFHFSPSTP